MASQIYDPIYSDTSGFSSDSEAFTSGVVYKVVDLAPRTSLFDGQETIILAFNNPLPRCPLIVEFKGEKRKIPMTVTARRLNNFTISVIAPVYYPVEKVTLTICNETAHNTVLARTNLFSYQEREDALQTLLLDEMVDPVSFLFRAFGYEPRDIDELDKKLRDSFLKHKPADFERLGDIPPSLRGSSRSDKKFPTLVHFAANFGLVKLLQEVLRCPGAAQACRILNQDSHFPFEMARQNSHFKVVDMLQKCEEAAGGAGAEGDPLYIAMEPEITYEAMQHPDQVSNRESAYMNRPDENNYDDVTITTEEESLYMNEEEHAEHLKKTKEESPYSDISRPDPIPVYDTPLSIPVPGLADDFKPRFYNQPMRRSHDDGMVPDDEYMDSDGKGELRRGNSVSSGKSVTSTKSSASNASQLSRSSTGTTHSKASSTYQADDEEETPPPPPPKDYDNDSPPQRPARPKVQTAERPPIAPPPAQRAPVQAPDPTPPPPVPKRTSSNLAEQLPERKAPAPVPRTRKKL